MTPIVRRKASVAKMTKTVTTTFDNQPGVLVEGYEGERARTSLASSPPGGASRHTWMACARSSMGSGHALLDAGAWLEAPSGGECWTGRCRYP